MTEREGKGEGSISIGHWMKYGRARHIEPIASLLHPYCMSQKTYDDGLFLSSISDPYTSRKKYGKISRHSEDFTKYTQHILASHFYLSQTRTLKKIFYFVETNKETRKETCVMLVCSTLDNKNKRSEANEV